MSDGFLAGHARGAPAVRTVVIVGPGPGCDIAAIAARVAAQRGELLLLATGWSTTEEQHRVIHEALDAAARLRLVCEARLVPGESDVEDHVVPGDRVIVPGSPEALEQPPVPTFA